MEQTSKFIGRERTRLERARANGYLNAICRASEPIRRAYSFWCWKLRLPIVWFERRSARSRYGRVHLDLFTTPNVLRKEAQAELAGIADRYQVRGPVAISPNGGVWDGVPPASIEEVARAVFRVATRFGNYELRTRTPSPEIVRMFETVRKRAQWKMSA